MNKEAISKGGWDHLHDVILDVTYNEGKLSLNQKELEELYDELPSHIKEDITHWGLNDTCVRDNIWEWYDLNKLNQNKDEVK